MRRAGFRDAEEQDSRAALGGGECLRGGDGVADALDDDVHTVHTGQRADARGQILVDRVNRGVRAQLQADLPAGLHRLAQQHLRRAGQLRQLHHQQSDCTAADDEHRVAGADLRAVDAVEAAGQRLGHGAVLQRKLRIEQEALRLGRIAEIGKAAVFIHADGVEVRAELLFATAAVMALAAVAIGVDGDMVADMQRFDRRADGGDRAGEFVAEHDRRNHLRGAFVPVVDMDVRPADTAGGDLNQDFARGERMLRHVPRFKCTVSKKIRSSHQLFPSITPRSQRREAAAS